MIRVKVDHAFVEQFYRLAYTAFPPFHVYEDYPIDDRYNVIVATGDYLPKDMIPLHVMTFHTFDYGDGAKKFTTWELSVDD